MLAPPIGGREEIGLPYRVHALDHTAGELDGDAYKRISPFRQAPVIDDDGFVVAESGAILLYLAEKAGKLIPRDTQGRTRVAQWCFAASATVGATLGCIDTIEIFDGDKAAPKLHTEARKLAARWLGDVERHLQDREWIACADFTVADIMMANVLRSIRKTDLMDPFPRRARHVRGAARRERRRYPLEELRSRSLRFATFAHGVASMRRVGTTSELEAEFRRVSFGHSRDLFVAMHAKDTCFSAQTQLLTRS
jgi:glutathione S-transferase